jgi:hypothetical protein
VKEFDKSAQQVACMPLVGEHPNDLGECVDKPGNFEDFTNNKEKKANTNIVIKSAMFKCSLSKIS